ADCPLFGKRLRERRIVLKLRDLDILLRLPADDAAAQRPRHAESQANGNRENYLLSNHDSPSFSGSRDITVNPLSNFVPSVLMVVSPGKPITTCREDFHAIIGWSVMNARRVTRASNSTE